MSTTHVAVGSANAAVLITIQTLLKKSATSPVGSSGKDKGPSYDCT